MRSSYGPRSHASRTLFGGDVSFPRPGWRSSSIFVLMRILKPRRFVETGVGMIGATTSYILEGLRRNQSGHLWSVDPNKFYVMYGFHVGAGIPAQLHERHSFVQGMSVEELPRLLAQLNGLDVFLHDGEHIYGTMFKEYSWASQYLRGRGCVLSDDTWNSAIDDFALVSGCVLTFAMYGGSHFAYGVQEMPLAGQI